MLSIGQSELYKQRSCVRFVFFIKQKKTTSGSSREMGKLEMLAKLATSYYNIILFLQRCYSNVGRIGGRQDISIGDGCQDILIFIHEMFHALGRWHEQSRPDRNQFVTILFKNVEPGSQVLVFTSVVLHVLLVVQISTQPLATKTTALLLYLLTGQEHNFRKVNSATTTYPRNPLRLATSLSCTMKLMISLAMANLPLGPKNLG